jgi:hypothetical protein
MICSPRVGKLKQCRKAWITLELVLASMDRYSFMYSPVSRNRKRGLMLFLVGRRGNAGIAKPVEGPKRALAKNRWNLHSFFRLSCGWRDAHSRATIGSALVRAMFPAATGAFAEIDQASNAPA